MAEFLPLKGIRYNPHLIGEMASVVAPPYDVISPSEQERYHAQHPNNIIRLILGRNEAGDDQEGNACTRAATFLSQWLREGILIEEPEAAFYLTSVTFEHEGRRISRLGVIGRARLMPFEKGVILPHERTFSKVKKEQLRLMQACHANLSPIFGLYTDGQGIFSELARIAQTESPAIDFRGEHDLQHTIWALTDPDQIAFITRALRDLKIYIADGHHRYETALNYRAWLEEQSGSLPDNHPANFVMMSLSSIEDPGMIIKSAHRLLKAIPAERAQNFIATARAFFEIFRFSTNEGVMAALAAAQALQKEHVDDIAIIAILAQHEELYLLVLKSGVMNESFSDEPESLRDLDVTVLTRLVMMELLGFDQAALDNENKTVYCSDALQSLQMVTGGQADMAFILNPTRIEQVKRISESGLIMPRKSTYFYPKVISGLVINPLW
jgi:uncharacterized protein (DUF1015 family)